MPGELNITQVSHLIAIREEHWFLIRFLSASLTHSFICCLIQHLYQWKKSLIPVNPYSCYFCAQACTCLARVWRPKKEEKKAPISLQNQAQCFCGSMGDVLRARKSIKLRNTHTQKKRNRKPCLMGIYNFFTTVTKVLSFWKNRRKKNMSGNTFRLEKFK